METLEKLAKEWPVIKQAPMSFLIITVVITGVLWIFFSWLFSERLQHRDENIAWYKDLYEKEKAKTFSAPNFQPGVTVQAINKIWENHKKDSIVGQQFGVGERVILDGHSYVDCTFDRVILIYNGTAPFDLSHNRLIAPITLISDNKGVLGAFTLIGEVNRLNEELKKKQLQQE